MMSHLVAWLPRNSRSLAGAKFDLHFACMLSSPWGVQLVIKAKTVTSWIYNMYTVRNGADLFDSQLISNKAGAFVDAVIILL